TPFPRSILTERRAVPSWLQPGSPVPQRAGKRLPLLRGSWGCVLPSMKAMKSRSASAGRGKASRARTGAGPSGPAKQPAVQGKKRRRPAAPPPEQALVEEPSVDDDGLPGEPSPEELGEVLIPEIALPLDDSGSESEEDDGEDAPARAGASDG